MSPALGREGSGEVLREGRWDSAPIPKVTPKDEENLKSVFAFQTLPGCTALSGAAHLHPGEDGEGDDKRT